MKKISRPVVVASLTLGVVSGAAPPSVAARAPFITLTPTVGPPTAVVALEASGFMKGEVVALFFDEVERVGSAIARGRPGNVETSFTVPADAAPGGHPVSAEGTSSGVVLETTLLVRTDWTQFHYDGATGFNPFENVLGPGNVSGIIIHDRRATEGAIVSQPVYCGGSVFVGDEAGNIYGVEDPDEFPWVFPTRGAVLGSPAAIPPAIPPGPCRVIAASMDGNLYALDGATGGLLWSVDVGAPIGSSPLLIKGQAPPDPEKVVVGDLAGMLHAFDANGNRLWASQLDGPVSTATAFSDPWLYVGTERGTLYQISAADGTMGWTATLDGAPTTPAVSKAFDPQPDPPGKVFVGTAAGTLYILDAASGATAGTFATGGPITGAPAIGGPNSIGDPNVRPIFVFGSHDGNIYAGDQINENPVPIWTARIGSPITTSPTLANGVLYFGADDSKLHAIDAATGQELFASEAITVTRSSPMVADGMVVVGTMSGEIVTFGPAG